MTYISGKNKDRFESELKLYINRRLYEKKIITEEMYSHAKAVLIKKAG